MPKEATYERLQTMLERAVEGSRRLGLDDAADEYERMSPEEYAEEKGITIVEQNPARSSGPLTLKHTRRSGNKMSLEAKRIEDLDPEEYQTVIDVAGTQARDALVSGSAKEMREALEFIGDLCHEDSELEVDVDSNEVEIVTFPDEESAR